MKKTKFFLISIIAVFTAMVCSAFVAPAFSENNVTVQSVDGTSIVNGNEKCSNFGNMECSIIGNNGAAISVTRVQRFR